jgi:hypothetical protein
MHKRFELTQDKDKETMMKSSLMIGVLVGMIALAQAAVAAPIAVGNAGFEDPKLDAGGSRQLGPGMPGVPSWTSSTINVYVLRCDEYGVTSGMEGANFLLLEPWAGSDQIVYQTLTDTLHPGTYTLTVAAGRQNYRDSTTLASTTFGLATYNGTTYTGLLASKTLGINDLVKGTLNKFSLEWTVTSGAAHLNEQVVIVLAAPFVNENYASIAYDNVRLDYAAVPEPGALALLAAGLAGLCWRKRR